MTLSNRCTRSAHVWVALSHLRVGILIVNTSLSPSVSFIQATGRLISLCQDFDYFSSLSICCFVCVHVYMFVYVLCCCVCLSFYVCVSYFFKSIYPCNLFKLYFCFRFLIFPVLVISSYTYLTMYISYFLFLV